MSRRVCSILLLAVTGCEYASVVGTRPLTGEDGSRDDGEEQADEADDGVDIPDAGAFECDPPPPLSCDGDSDNLLHAVGLDCIGGIPAAGGASGPAGSQASYAGSLGPYSPREGERMLIMSTGRAEHLPLEHTELSELGCDEPLYCPNTNFGVGPGVLPKPLTFQPVDADLSCVDDPSLVGSGDCSNSLYEQWSACGLDCELWDYSELRLGLTVPAKSYGLAFDLAFMSTEWPSFAGSGFNDMFVAWLESESWTGNVSFDGNGNPITVNAGFTDYRGSELAGFAMEGHAGTRWLTTSFGVQPDERLTLVLAVFDIGDGSYDSVALVDGFRWTCSGTTPTTEPVP